MKRIEYKYLIPADLAEEFRLRAEPFITRDIIAHRTHSVFYTVRSIYYDTPQLDSYHEKLEGIPIRKKIRIRGYNQRRDSSVAVLEIKRKQNQNVWKDRAPVLFCNIPDLLSSGHIERYVLLHSRTPNAVSDARKFLFHLHRTTIKPQTCVVYDRIAYHGRFDTSFRLTFDRNLRYALTPAIEELYSEQRMIPERNRDHIMEIKFCTTIPIWLRSLIELYGLQRRSISKYGLSVDALSRKTRGSQLNERQRIRSFAMGIM